MSRAFPLLLSPTMERVQGLKPAAGGDEDDTTQLAEAWLVQVMCVLLRV